ncbi:MAG TPA: hypothetical protein VFZ98_00050 [Vicinamibacterales bacterium]
MRDSVVNAVIGALAALVITQGVPGVWRAKETVSAHNADVQRILDVLCEIKPEARACSQMNGSAKEIAQR